MKRSVITKKGEVKINGWMDYELWRYQTAEGWVFLKAHRSKKKRTDVYYAWDWIGDSSDVVWKEKGWVIYILSREQVKKYIEWLDKDNLLKDYQRDNAIKFKLINKENKENKSKNRDTADIVFNRIMQDFTQHNITIIPHLKKVKL